MMAVENWLPEVVTLQGEYEPSAAQWVRDQVEQYERSGGTEANSLRGQAEWPIVVIASRGYKSGKLRKNPVMRVEKDGVYAAIASQGGAPSHPTWYHNFVAHPHVELQDGADKRDYEARVLEGDERAEWWARAIEVWPDYEGYQKKTDRQIPVFLLTPKD